MPVSMVLQSRWENKGVAPVYHAWPLAYRLRSGSGAGRGAVDELR